MDLLHTAHVPAGDGPFPTVIALHGWGASAHDLLGLAPLLHGGGALVLCPQGPWALAEAGSFAGLVALASWLPGSLADAVGKTPEQAELPVLVLHGTRDTMVSVDMARASRERLRDFGVQLMYRELDMAHELNPEALRIIARWLEEKAFGE